MTGHQVEEKVNMWSGTALGFMFPMLWEAKNLAASAIEKFLLRKSASKFSLVPICFTTGKNSNFTTR